MTMSDETELTVVTGSGLIAQATERYMREQEDKRMDTNWKAVKRGAHHYYVEKGDGTAILSACGTPVQEREQIVKLAALAPAMARNLIALMDGEDVFAELDALVERLRDDGPLPNDNLEGNERFDALERARANGDGVAAAAGLTAYAVEGS